MDRVASRATMTNVLPWVLLLAVSVYWARNALSSRGVRLETVKYRIWDLYPRSRFEKFYIRRMSDGEIVNFFKNRTDIRWLMERHLQMGYDAVSSADVIRGVTGLPMQGGSVPSVILMAFRPFGKRKYDYFDWKPAEGLIWMINPCWMDPATVSADERDALRRAFGSEDVYTSQDGPWDAALANYRTIVASVHDPTRYAIRNVLRHPLSAYQAAALKEIFDRYVPSGHRCFRTE